MKNKKTILITIMLIAFICAIITIPQTTKFLKLHKIGNKNEIFYRGLASKTADYRVESGYAKVILEDDAWNAELTIDENEKVTVIEYAYTTKNPKEDMKDADYNLRRLTQIIESYTEQDIAIKGFSKGIKNEILTPQDNTVDNIEMHTERNKQKAYMCVDKKDASNSLHFILYL